MPRKQRFKPSRKPKPVPQAEDAAIGREVNSPVHNDNVEPDEARERDDDSMNDDKPDQSR